MSEITVTSKDLYDTGRSELMLSYQKSIKSLVTVYSRYEAYEIPLPKAGHWMKQQFGKKVRIILFPESFEGEVTITLSLRTGF